MKTVYTEEYKLLCNWLVNKRQSAKLTQTELAELLNRPQSYVSKYENGERRLDVLEFIEIAKVLNANPSEIIMVIYRTLKE
ncbi:MAG: helix-turn-helix transcriptional regulator [Anaerolineales bacterium]|nr:helix-turn-helix transcriptional regulator [Anaerolineales bacterium]